MRWPIQSTFYGVGLFSVCNLCEIVLEAVLLKKSHVPQKRMYTYTHTHDQWSSVIVKKRTHGAQEWCKYEDSDYGWTLGLNPRPWIGPACWAPLCVDRHRSSKPQRQFGPLLTVVLSKAPEPNCKHVINWSQMPLAYNESFCFCTSCPNCCLSVSLPLQNKRASPPGCYSY